MAEIVNGYLSDAEASAYVGTSVTTTADFVNDCVTAASRKIDDHTGRRFYVDGSDEEPVSRSFDATGGSCLDFGRFGDLVTLAALEVSDVAIDADSFELVQVDGHGPGAPYGGLRLLGGTFPTPGPQERRRVIDVSGIWGWAEVPVQVTAACRLMVAELVKLRDAPLGIAGGADFGALYTRSSLPPRAVDMLSPFRHASTFGIA